jgi:hypothetical protein
MTELKKQIKGWELEMDSIVNALQIVFEDSTLGDIPNIQERLEIVSNEMMAINL